MPLLFSYGTLQLEQVQLETFGRLLKGEKEVLRGYKLTDLEITDAEVLRKSGKKIHTIALFTGNKNDSIEGFLYEITDDELMHADAYEVKDYKRIEVVFESGRKGFVYIAK